MQVRIRILAAVCVVTFAIPVWAHHSHVNYAVSDFTFLEGTVTEILYLNPHSWVYLEVEDANGESAVWSLEATGPRGLEGNGITREDVRVGAGLALPEASLAIIRRVPPPMDTEIRVASRTVSRMRRAVTSKDSPKRRSVPVRSK